MHLAGVRLALGDRGMRRMRGGAFAGLPRGVRRSRRAFVGWPRGVHRIGGRGAFTGLAAAGRDGARG